MKTTNQLFYTIKIKSRIFAAFYCCTNITVPTGALDYQTGKSILKLLQDTCRRGITVVVITHNQAIAPMADRIIKIKNGRVSETKINETPKSVEEIEW